MIRINEEQFISLNAVSFKVYEIDEIISKFFKEKSIGIKEIISFAAFPECGVTWNYYVLESYLKHFSLMYKYCTNLSNSGNAGAIVRRNQNFDYFDILVDAVSKSKCNLEKDEIYSLLVEKGYMRKKYYKRIDLLIDVIKKGISS